MCVILYGVLLKQEDNAEVLVRGRREAVNFWKRLQQYPDTANKAFWKRAHPHDTLDSFWKRGMPSGAGVQAFWKRFVETATDDDLASALGRIAGPYRHAADKKNVDVARQQQQRRAKEMSGRRPEFNPTGW